MYKALKHLTLFSFILCCFNCFSCNYLLRKANQLNDRVFSDIFRQKGIVFFTHDTELYRLESILKEGKLLPGVKIKGQVEVGSNASSFVGTNSFATAFLSAFDKKRTYIFENFDRFNSLNEKVPIKMIFSSKVVDFYDFSAHSGWSGGLPKKNIKHFRTTNEIDILNFEQIVKNSGFEPWFADKELIFSDKKKQNNLIEVIEDILKKPSNEFMFHEVDLSFLKYIVVPSSLKLSILDKLKGIDPISNKTINDLIISPDEVINKMDLN